MPTERPARHPALLLTALALAQLTIGIDYNIIFVALPAIGDDVAFTAQNLQWVVNAYAVAFGGFLLLGGRLADLVGRRRVFVLGLTLYAVASVAGTLATTPGLLVGARALQGIGGALLAPATLSLVTTSFAEGRARNSALAVWGAAGSSGMVIGSLLGGILTEAFGWPAVFAVNVPLAAAIALLGIAVIPADPPAGGRTVDIGGAVTITAGVSLLVFGLVEGPAQGWIALPTATALVAAAVLIVVFLAIERRSADPLVPPDLLRTRSLAVGTAITFLFMATFGASAYFLTIALQDLRGHDALTTGVAFIVPCAMVLIGTIVGGRLASRVGVRTTLMAGLLMGAAGTALFAWSLTADTTDLRMLPGVVVLSLGQGIVFIAMFAAATSGIPAEHQGLASGIATSGQQVGGAVGLAVLVAVANSAAGVGSGPAATEAALAGGLRAAMAVAAVLMLLAVGVAALLARRPAVPAPDTVPAEPVAADSATPLRCG